MALRHEKAEPHLNTNCAVFKKHVVISPSTEVRCKQLAPRCLTDVILGHISLVHAV